MFFVRKFQGTRTSLLRVRQRSSYLEKASSFLRAGLLPPPANPLLTAKSLILCRKSSELGRRDTGTPCTQRKRILPSSRCPSHPGPNSGRFPRYKRESTSPGSPGCLPAEYSAALEERSSFTLYFQSCSLPAARSCTERRRFAPSFCSDIHAKTKNQTISKTFFFSFLL